MGVPWSDSRFTDNDNGTVTENLTGLMWLKNAKCFQGQGWCDALIASNNLADGQCELSDGSSPGDWRLPNVTEFYSLIDHGEWDPELPIGHPFTNVQSEFYWSSTTSAHHNVYAWGIGILGAEVSVGLKIAPYNHVWSVHGSN